MSLYPEHLGRDIKELVLRLPWWVGLLCALASYLLLHPLTFLHAPAPVGMLDIVVTAIGQLLVGVASVAQFLIPLTFLALAASSAFFNWKRQELRWTLRSNPGGTGLRSLSLEDLLLLVTSAYRAYGFQARETEKGLYRDGFDLELSRAGERYLLQLRNWKSSSMEATTLRELYARLKRSQADGALVLISGRFSPDAEAFAEGRRIALMDGHGLKDLVLSRKPGKLAELADAAAHRFGIVGRRDRRAIEDGVAPTSLGISDTPRDPDDAERDVGKALGGLILQELQTGDDSPALPKGIPVPPSRSRTLESAGPAARNRRRDSISAGRIANALGVALTLGLFWITYQQFNALPAATTATPWALLGQGQPLGRKAESQSPPSGEQAKGGEEVRPLGQLSYGPEFPVSPAFGGLAQRSVRELEEAFNALYEPPPFCYDWSSPAALAECGNHRIRARRAFVASNGSLMMPAELPPGFQPVPDSEWTGSPEHRSQTWQEEELWRQRSEQDYGGIGPESASGWRSPLTEDLRWNGYPETWHREERGPVPYLPDRPPRGPPPARAESSEPDWYAPGGAVPYEGPQVRGDWRVVPGEGPWSGWEHHEWQAGHGPLPGPSRYPPSAQTEVPPDAHQAHRQSVEDWLPRDRNRLDNWREEERLRERYIQEETAAWGQEAATFDDVYDPGIGETPEDGEHARRREWLGSP